jgi:hypothetical protein
MKPAGIAVAAAAIAATAVHASRQFLADGTLRGLDVASAVLSVVMLALWAMRFTRLWVKATADAYSSQLVAAIDSLAPADR